MVLADALHGLLRLPGATYACVVERDSGRVLAETGQGEGGAGDHEGVVPYSVAQWGTAVAAMFDSTSGDELDDVMIAGRRSYHLVRPLGATAAVLVYLRLDRARSNLAAARRELAGVRWGPLAAPPAGRAAAPTAPPSAVPGPAASLPAASGTRRPAAAPRAHRAIAEARAARSAGEVRVAGGGVRTGGSGAPDPPQGPAPPSTRVAAALPPASTPTRGLPAVADPRTTRPDAAPAPAGTPRIPLPRRAPTAHGSDLVTRGRVPAPADAPLPDGFVVPPVLGQSWARDPGTLRRLIAGLRRLT